MDETLIYETLVEMFEANDIAYDGEKLFQKCIELARDVLE